MDPCYERLNWSGLSTELWLMGDSTLFLPFPELVQKLFILSTAFEP